MICRTFYFFVWADTVEKMCIRDSYQCALMEVETKFRVLNEQFSLAHDRNPIESIKTRVKSLESITEKLNRKMCIRDRVWCAFA